MYPKLSGFRLTLKLLVSYTDNIENSLDPDKS